MALNNQVVVPAIVNGRPASLPMRPLKRRRQAPFHAGHFDDRFVPQKMTKGLRRQIAKVARHNKPEADRQAGMVG